MSCPPILYNVPLDYCEAGTYDCVVTEHGRDPAGDTLLYTMSSFIALVLGSPSKCRGAYTGLVSKHKCGPTLVFL